MQIELPVASIASAISAAAALASSKDFKSVVFKCVLLDAQEDRLVIRASSALRSIEVVVPHKPVTVGKVLIDSEKLGQIMNANQAADVKIVSVEKSCKISFGRMRSFSLSTEPPEDFPDLTFFNDKNSSFKMPVDTLLAMCKRAISSVHKDRSKLLLHGLCFHLVDGRLRILGTTGLVLSYTSIAVTNALEGVVIDQAVVMPDVVELFGKVASAGTEIELQFTQRSLNVRGDCGQAAALRLIGSYPPYERAIPKIPGNDIAIKRKELFNLLAQLNVIDFMGVPTLQLVLENNLATWTSQGQDGTFYQEDAVTWPHDKVVLYFNPKTLVASLKGLTAQDFSFEVVNGISATVVRESGTGFDSFCIVAPLRPGNA
jgi:DNA polymerase III sliding clamp (beta) subunit (PCNA family)